MVLLGVLLLGGMTGAFSSRGKKRRKKARSKDVLDPFGGF
jgi:hypothetical protein